VETKTSSVFFLADFLTAVPGDSFALIGVGWTIFNAEKEVLRVTMVDSSEVLKMWWKKNEECEGNQMVVGRVSTGDQKIWSVDEDESWYSYRKGI